MMAKMFYRFDEARQVLGMSDEQLKQLTREGKLREFRDGAQVMYKADQVDQLKSELGLGDPNAVDLGPSDTGGPLGLSDTRGEGGSGLGGTLGGSLSGTSGGSVISLADSSSKDDTATDMALSGSGSGSGINLSSTSTGSGISLSNTGTSTGIGMKTGTKSGVSVLGLDEGGTADPSAATAMGGSFGGEPSLEAMGSGSGLLDLSRERDDTSLGAPILDEMTAGSSRAGGSSLGSLAAAAPLTGSSTAQVAARSGAMPVYVDAPDNFTGFAAGASFGAAALALVALYAVAAAAMRAQPTFLSFMFTGTAAARHSYPMLYVLGGGLAAALLFGVIGFVAGKRR